MRQGQMVRRHGLGSHINKNPKVWGIAKGQTLRCREGRASISLRSEQPGENRCTEPLWTRSKDVIPYRVPSRNYFVNVDRLPSAAPICDRGCLWLNTMRLTHTFVE
eukprot:scaffold568_cov160-Amphora_coffeaeformis.AAC.3